MAENLLVVNAEGPETRVGLLENGVLAEFFLERKRERGIVGNIYRGRVLRVLPGMQAAFVDLGSGVDKAAFLYVGEVLGAGGDKKLGDLDDDAPEDAPESTASRLVRSRKKQAAQRKIEDVVKVGQEMLVQVVKDPIGEKGARVTGYISLPGRFGVLMPAVDHVGVSRRIGTDAERKRLREVVNSVRPKGAGFIVRTAAAGADEQEVRDDVNFLLRLWGQIKARDAKQRGAGLIYADLDLVLRTIRDMLREEIAGIMIDDQEQFERARKFAGAFLPKYADRIRRYEGRQPIFDAYGIEPALRAAVSRHVPLTSGGHLVIDQGEALTAIDVNTGRFVGISGDDLETTVTRNNMEATAEVARQLRLRNIGGIIVVDFVDMDKEANRRKVWDAFNAALAKDRSRCNVTKISELGLVEMTRKRTRESLVQLLTEPCPVCEGAATVKSVTTVAYDLLRDVRRLGPSVEADSIEIEVPPRIADYLKRHERDYLDLLEKKLHKKVEIQINSQLKPDQYKVAGRVSEPVQSGKPTGGGGTGGKSGGKRRRGKRGGKDKTKSAPTPEAGA
jgi:ribonuclease G